MSKPRRDGQLNGHANDYPKTDLSFTDAIRELSRHPHKLFQMRRRQWSSEWAIRLHNYGLLILTNNNEPWEGRAVKGSFHIDVSQMLSSDWIVERTP